MAIVPDLNLRRVVALSVVVIGLGLAAGNAFAGDSVLAFPWTVFAAVGVVYFRRFEGTGRARV